MILTAVILSSLFSAKAVLACIGVAPLELCSDDFIKKNDQFHINQLDCYDTQYDYFPDTLWFSFVSPELFKVCGPPAPRWWLFCQAKYKEDDLARLRCYKNESSILRFMEKD